MLEESRIRTEDDVVCYDEQKICFLNIQIISSDSGFNL